MVFALGLPAVDVPDRGILPSSGFRPGCLRLCADCPTTVSMLSIKCKAYLVIFLAARGSCSPGLLLGVTLPPPSFQGRRPRWRGEDRNRCRIFFAADERRH